MLAEAIEFADWSPGDPPIEIFGRFGRHDQTETICPWTVSPRASVVFGLVIGMISGRGINAHLR